MNLVAMMVRTFMTSFVRLLMLERKVSCIPESISRNASAVSMTWIVWSYTSFRY